MKELRLAALEARIEADLALGRHDQITAELDQLADAGAAPLRPADAVSSRIARGRPGQAGCLGAWGLVAGAVRVRRAPQPAGGQCRRAYLGAASSAAAKSFRAW
jgi:hypothetical protein